MADIFLYSFEFRSSVNPPKREDEFCESFRSYIESRDLDYGMSAMGGMRGHVEGKHREISEEDRIALVEWAKSQPVKCTAKLGSIEELTDNTEFFREITESVFQIDNLSRQDRKLADQTFESRVQNVKDFLKREGRQNEAEAIIQKMRENYRLNSEKG